MHSPPLQILLAAVAVVMAAGEERKHDRQHSQGQQQHLHHGGQHSALRQHSRGEGTSVSRAGLYPEYTHPTIPGRCKNNVWETDYDDCHHPVTIEGSNGPYQYWGWCASLKNTAGNYWGYHGFYDLKADMMDETKVSIEHTFKWPSGNPKQPLYTAKEWVQADDCCIVERERCFAKCMQTSCTFNTYDFRWYLAGWIPECSKYPNHHLKCYDIDKECSAQCDRDLKRKFGNVLRDLNKDSFEGEWWDLSDYAQFEYFQDGLAAGNKEYCSCFGDSSATPSPAVINGCKQNEYVKSHVCTPCPPDHKHVAGANPAGGDTTCLATVLPKGDETATPCDRDFHLVNGVCTACAPGTFRPAGDNPKFTAIKNTVCVPKTCGINEFVENHACVACPEGYTRSAGDSTDSAVNTRCSLCAKDYHVVNKKCVLCEDICLTNAEGNDSDGDDTVCSLRSSSSIETVDGVEIDLPPQRVQAMEYLVREFAQKLSCQMATAKLALVTSKGVLDESENKQLLELTAAKEACCSLDLNQSILCRNPDKILSDEEEALLTLKAGLDTSVVKYLKTRKALEGNNLIGACEGWKPTCEGAYQAATEEDNGECKCAKGFLGTAVLLNGQWNGCMKDITPCPTTRGYVGEPGECECDGGAVDAAGKPTPYIGEPKQDSKTGEWSGCDNSGVCDGVCYVVDPANSAQCVCNAEGNCAGTASNAGGTWGGCDPCPYPGFKSGGATCVCDTPLYGGVVARGPDGKLQGCESLQPPPIPADSATEAEILDFIVQYCEIPFKQERLGLPPRSATPTENKRVQNWPKRAKKVPENTIKRLAEMFKDQAVNSFAKTAQWSIGAVMNECAKLSNNRFVVKAS